MSSNLRSSHNLAEAGKPLILMSTDINCLLDFTVNLRHFSFYIFPPKLCKNTIKGAKEMEQWLRALAVFSEDLYSTASIFVVAHNHL